MLLLHLHGRLAMQLQRIEQSCFWAMFYAALMGSGLVPLKTAAPQ